MSAQQPCEQRSNTGRIGLLLRYIFSGAHIVTRIGGFFFPFFFPLGRPGRWFLVPSPVVNRTGNAMAQSLPSPLCLVDVTESEDTGDGGMTPPPSDIRRSLSPLLDFNRGGERRNFCNISECAFCRPMVDNHRLSPLRSPVISPSSKFFPFSAPAVPHLPTGEKIEPTHFPREERRRPERFLLRPTTMPSM